MKLSGLIISVLIFATKTLFSQYLATDTVFIPLKYNSLIPVSLHIDSINDNRHAKDKYISYTTKKKLLLIPVDQEIYLEKPLNESLLKSLKTNLKPSDTISFDINHFIIKRFKGRFSSQYILEADFIIISNNKNIGTLTYNFGYEPKFRKTPKPKICEEILYNWSTQFRLDLLSANNYLDDKKLAKPNNFLTESFKRSSFFNTTIGAVAGLNFWQIEGEMYFTRPETGENRLFRAGIIRYQNNTELEMIGFGKKTEHFNKRIAPNTLFDLSTNFLIGINKWKNSDDIKLQQVVQFSFSSNQSINFDKKNKSGLIFKAGLFENVYYIIEKQVKFQIGIYLSTGYKF